MTGKRCFSLETCVNHVVSGSSTLLTAAIFHLDRPGHCQQGHSAPRGGELAYPEARALKELHPQRLDRTKTRSTLAKLRPAPPSGNPPPRSFISRRTASSDLSKLAEAEQGSSLTSHRCDYLCTKCRSVRFEEITPSTISAPLQVPCMCMGVVIGIGTTFCA